MHGGAEKAVYCYPFEHYAYWKRELPGKNLPFGMFGENLTLEGVSEETVHIGDRFTFGSATLVVTQPRLPCYKLGIKFKSDAMVKRFLASGRTGFYFAVESEGAVAAGDRVAITERESHAVPVSEIVRLYVAKKFNDADVASVQKALRVDALTESWKEHFRERLTR